jgi:hypothetical protein
MTVNEAIQKLIALREEEPALGNSPIYLGYTQWDNDIARDIEEPITEITPEGTPALQPKVFFH